MILLFLALLVTIGFGALGMWLGIVATVDGDHARAERLLASCIILWGVAFIILYTKAVVK